LNSTVASAIPTDITPPAQITGVTITVISEGNSLNITWNPSAASDFVEYWLYRNSTTELWSRIATPTTASYQDMGLTNGKTYWYKVSAVDEVPNEGLNSTIKFGKPKDTDFPPAITTLIVTVIPTGNSLNISWGLVAALDMNEYQIYRDTSSGFSPSPVNNIANIPHPTSFYVDSGLTDGVTYYYKVLAVDDDGNWLPAVTQRSGTPQDTVPPLQPAIVNMTNINGAIYLNWTIAQESDFVKYEIWRNGSWILIQTITNRTINYYLDPSDNLFDNYYYYYEIRVFDEVGYNSTAPPKLTQIISPDGDNTPPTNIITLVAANLGTEGNVRLQWEAPPDKDITYYKVYRSLTSGFIPSISNLIGTTTNIYYNDYDPALNGTGIFYYYQVRATDENNNTALGGNEASVSVIDQQRPISLLTFTATSETDGSITLSWTATTPPDFQSYNIYRWQGLNLQFPTNPSTLIAKITISTTLSYNDNESNLIDGQLYTYKIAVADEVGDSPTKYTTGFTSGDPSAPSAPTGLNVINEGTGDILNLTWNRNPELDIHHYTVYRNSTTQSWMFVANTTSNYYQDSGLSEFQRYFYYVTAVDEEYNEGNTSIINSGIPIDTKSPGPPIINEPIAKYGRTAILNIKTPPDLDVLYYNIYRSNTSGFIPNASNLIAFNVSKTPGELTTYLDPDLPIGIYYYKVIALDEKYQASLPSNEANITITLYAPILTSIVDNTNGDITLKWIDDSRNPLEYILWYYIYRNCSSNFELIFIANITSQKTPMEYLTTDFGLPNGNWSYYATTVDKYHGESVISQLKFIVINDTVNPSAPTGLQ